jgi:hypothetical protein
MLIKFGTPSEGVNGAIKPIPKRRTGKMNRTIDIIVFMFSVFRAPFLIACLS